MDWDFWLRYLGYNATMFFSCAVWGYIVLRLWRIV
jgi:hypothetical protein